MTGRQKIEAAFSKDGTREIPAVICYEGIYIRDHWEQLTSYPWWYQQVPDIERQMLWRSEVIEKTRQDWFALPSFHSREGRENISIEVRQGDVLRINRRTGTEKLLERPRIGGWSKSGEPQSIRPHRLAETSGEIDELIPIPPEFDAKALPTDGRDDLASELLKRFGRDLYPICSVGSPLWRCYSLWGFEGMMTMIAARPALVKYASERFLTLSIRRVREAAVLGAAGIWVEECLTDMISPDSFGALNVPVLRRLIGEIASAGIKSIYYFCGSPAGKWEQLLSVGADALALEEGKKGFTVDIEEIVNKVRGRCTVLGNLDAVGILQDGTKERLRREISRQVVAGRRNGNRFIMSLGSPVTPGTPVEKVRLYCDLVHELGGT